MLPGNCEFVLTAAHTACTMQDNRLECAVKVTVWPTTPRFLYCAVCGFKTHTLPTLFKTNHPRLWFPFKTFIQTVMAVAVNGNSNLHSWQTDLDVRSVSQLRKNVDCRRVKCHSRLKNVAFNNEVGERIKLKDMDFAIWLYATRNTETVLRQNMCLTINV